MSITPHPAGIALAVLFVALLLLIYLWMFAVPPHVPREVAVISNSVEGIQRILVPVSSNLISERAVELACQLGESQEAEIILTHVIEVPLTLALETPMPELLARGQKALDTALQIVERYDLRAAVRLVPQRQIAAGIVQLAVRERVDAIVMAARWERRGVAEGNVDRISQEVLRRAPCDVILYRVPGREQARSAARD